MKGNSVGDMCVYCIVVDEREDGTPFKRLYPAFTLDGITRARYIEEREIVRGYWHPSEYGGSWFRVYKDA